MGESELKKGGQCGHASPSPILVSDPRVPGGGEHSNKKGVSGTEF